ncbi:CRISPR-associated helicase Cas3' [Clostridiaceae bacterium M8S5]|nr:CRISPR-associated helicase Cas3' [Clostridiaceae bacterium M8S5]
MNLSEYSAKPNKTIREHTDDLLKNLSILWDLRYITDKHLYDLIKLACEYHDYGKANREFQYRIKNKTKFKEDKEIAHNVLSLCFINKNDFEDKDDYYRVGFAVLNHHNYCDNFQVLDEQKELVQSLLDDFGVKVVKKRTIKKLKEITEDKQNILIKGFLHKCDYSASGDITIEYNNDYLLGGLDNLLSKWKKNDSRAEWNELQKFCIENTDKNIVVTAQTGMGKTEAGLHWIGDNKGFFILPLKTAINAIYERVKTDILEHKKLETRLALLHSDAMSYYNKNNKNENDEMDIMDYFNKSKQLSMPLSISTLDQLFDFVFKYQGYELKLSTLSYSKIVIDEIQMYSADLLAYLIYGMKKINKLGGKIAILTATLAPFIKDLLKNGQDAIEFVEGVFRNDTKRHNVKTLESKIEVDIIIDKYLENNEEKTSNKILVVCNTVKKAQEIYKELLERGLSNVNILHSKFTKADRSKKEEDILDFGKTEYKGQGIWVSTQIVEASLDIDFDYLFTELSDLSGLFQRLGRCNRKGEKSTDKTNCFVFLDIDKNLLTNGDKGFIDKKIYELSREALRQIDGVLSEKTKIDMINNCLTTQHLEGSDYLRKYRKYYRWIEDLAPYEIDKKNINLRNIVSYDVLPCSVYQLHKKEIDENLERLEDLKTDDLGLNTRLERVALKEEIKKYTVPVGRYDIFYKGYSAVTQNIKLSRKESIPVVNCKYDDFGFVRLTSEDIKEIEDNYDNFL